MKPQKRTDVKSGAVRWVGRYTAPDGRERSKSFPTRREAVVWAAERERETRRGEWIDPRSQQVTLGVLMDAHARRASRRNTRLAREFAADNLGALRDTPVGSLRTSDLRAWLDQLTSGRPWADGRAALSHASAALVFATVKSVLRLAVADRLLLASPAAGVRLAAPKVEKVTAADLLTREDVELVRSLAGEVLSTVVLLSAATGLRGSELGGLRVRSVDFLRRELHVTEQAGRKGWPWSWEPLKSDSATRTVPLPQVAVDALAAHLAAHPPASRDDPLFLTRPGYQWTVVSLGSMWAELRGRARARAGVAAGAPGPLDRFTWHDLRHFYASRLIYAGASVTTVQHRLGHANPTVTLRVYAHLWPGEDERTRDAIDGFLAPGRADSGQIAGPGVGAQGAG